MVVESATIYEGIQMDKLDEGILKLAVDRGLIHPDELKVPHTPDLLTILIEQGKLSAANFEALRAELLDEMKTLADPVWALAEPEKKDRKDEISITVFGRYIQLRLIGQGGMARVYRGYDPTLGRLVALKLLDEESERLMLEARSQARVEHENVCKVYEVGEVEGKQYICMQYVQGKTLGDAAKEMNLAQRIDVIRKITDAVHSAHKQGLVHRDIKPSNIMLEKTESGTWKPYILDFGLARMQAAPGITLTGTIIGTPHYMPPEQARGATIDARSDIYSLGATLYELITEKPPFSGTAPEVILKVLQEDPVPILKTIPQISPDLETIVMKCLEKDPAARYESARALAEDLARFLDGEPIHARPASLMYKTAKWVRKNPLISGISAVALAAILLLAGVAFYVQWRSDQQARYLHEFGQEATRIEGIMRFAYLLPLHNVRPEMAQVEARLKEIERRMQDLGKTAYGPGHYSIGRGFLAQHKYQTAHEHLIRAWDQYEYRQPSVAYALGYSLAMLYQQKLREAEQTVDKTQLKSRKDQLDKTYRDPALKFIRQGVTSTEAPEYVSALISFYSQDYENSLKHAETASEKFSWFYEAKKLQGDVYKAMGSEQQEAGQIHKAEGFFDKARTAYLEAARKGQSDPDIYGGLCALHEKIIRMQMTQTAVTPQKTYEEGISYCDSALRADPQNVSALLTSAQINTNWGYYQRTHGQDLRKTIQKAVQVAKIALRSDPENPSAHIALGNAYGSLADDEIDKEGNPIAFLNLADISYAAAVKRSPQDPKAHYLQGKNFLERSRYEMISGKDPRPSLQKAIPSLQRAVNHSPTVMTYSSSLGIAYWTKSQYEIGNGLDPSQSLTRAIDLFKRTNEINPSYMNGYIYTGAAHIHMADWQIDCGQVPLHELDAAIAAYEKALKIDPQNPYSFAGIGYALWKKGNWIYEDRKDPTPILDSAREALQKALDYNKNMLECYAIYANVEQIAARHAIDQKRRPEQFLNKSQDILDKGLALSPKAYEILEALASLFLLRAEYQYSLNQSIAAEITKGIQAADRSLTANSQVASAHVTRAKLYLLLARSASAQQRVKAALEAEVSFLRAIKIKSTLAKKYENELQEAKRLAN